MKKLLSLFFSKKDDSTTHLNVHWNRLKQISTRQEKEYQDYLKIQLKRTLVKIDTDSTLRTKYLLTKLSECAAISKRGKILCVGCRNIKEITAFHSLGFYNVTGIDVYSDNETILLMDMHYMTFQDDTFDLIYCSHALEHSIDPERALSEFARVAKDGAIFIIEVPTNYPVMGADLVDFRSIGNLYERIETVVQVKEKLFDEELAVDSENNFSGTKIIRIIFRIQK